MLKTYCQHCGTKHEYVSVKPNFCTSCGQPISGAKIEKPKEENLHVHSRAMETLIDDPDGTDVFEVPQLSSLAYDIEIDKSSIFELGSVIPEDVKKGVNTKPKRKRGRPRKGE